MSKQKITLTPKTAKKINTPTRSLLIALAASSTLLIPPIIFNLQNQKTHPPTINLQETTQQAQQNTNTLLANPTLEPTWYTNYSRWKNNTTEKVPTWEAGFIAPNNQHIALTQTANANDTWIANTTQNAPPTGTRNINGQTWQIRDKGNNNHKNLILTTTQSTIILKSKTNFQELDTLATAITNHLCNQNNTCHPNTPQNPNN